MNWNEIFTPDNLYNIGVGIGTILFTAWLTVKTLLKQLKTNEENSKGEVAKTIKKQSVTDAEIMQEAERLKEMMGADRIQVYEFHNGMHYANGRSALKTTCTYEACRYGVNSCINILSGLPLSCIPNFIKKLLNDGEMYIKDLEEIKESMPSTYSFKKSMGISSFYDVVITNQNNEPIGFVAVQFCDGKEHKVNKNAVKKFAWYIENKLFEHVK